MFYLNQFYFNISNLEFYHFYYFFYIIFNQNNTTKYFLNYHQLKINNIFLKQTIYLINS